MSTQCYSVPSDKLVIWVQNDYHGHLHHAIAQVYGMERCKVHLARHYLQKGDQATLDKDLQAIEKNPGGLYWGRVSWGQVKVPPPRILDKVHQQALLLVLE